MIRNPHAFSPNGEWLACVGRQNDTSAIVQVWDRSGNRLAEFRIQDEPESLTAGKLRVREVSSLEWIDDATFLIATDTKLLAFTLRSPDRPLARAEIDNALTSPSPFVDLAFTGRGSVWGLGATGELRQLSLAGDVLTVASPHLAPEQIAARICRANPPGAVVAVGTASGGVALFHVATRSYRASDRTGHRASVDALAWIDESSLVSGGADGSLTLWRTSRKGELERWFSLRLDNPVVGISAAITGRHLYVALAKEPTLRLIDLDALESGLRELLLEEPNPNVSQTN
jgi:WD40 repeat protein